MKWKKYLSEKIVTMFNYILGKTYKSLLTIKESRWCFNRLNFLPRGIDMLHLSSFSARAAILYVSLFVKEVSSNAEFLRLQSKRNLSYLSVFSYHCVVIADCLSVIYPMCLCEIHLRVLLGFNVNADFFEIHVWSFKRALETKGIEFIWFLRWDFMEIWTALQKN